MDTQLHQDSRAARAANPRLDPNRLAEELIRVGEDGIAKENDAALQAYFAPDYVFHGPQGDMSFAELKGYFAALRKSLAGFTVARERILVLGNIVAARTRMSGVFEREFPYSPVGSVQPTHKPVSFVLHGFFRYDDAGKLAEEWVELDNLGFAKQLGVDLVRSNPSPEPRP
jgi:hypothetical protein